MSSMLEMQAAKVTIAMSGLEGAQRLIIADDDKIVVSTNMKVGAYTIAAQPAYPSIIGVLATSGATADTMGTVTITGTGADGAAYTEVVTPIAGTTVLTINPFKTITSVVGAGWVIDEVEGTNDTIKVGVASSGAGRGKFFSAIQVLTNTVVASQTDVAGAIVPNYAGFTALIAGNIYPCKCTHLAITSGEAIAYTSIM